MFFRSGTFIAEGTDRTVAATRVPGGAARLAEGNEIGVPGFPVTDGKDFTQRHFRLKRIFCPEQSKPVGNTVDVDIHANGRFVETERDDEVRGFPPYAGKFAQRFDRIGKDASELRLEDVRERFQMPCLFMVKPDGEDEIFQPFQRDFPKVAGRGNLSEEPPDGACRTGVFRPCAKDRPDQYVKGVAGLRRHQFDNRRVLFSELFFQ